MRLISTVTGKEIKIGDFVPTFRNELVRITDFNERRVYCNDVEGRSNEWFPSVINAKVVD